MRSVGPTVVVTLLLDGPQLGSRWAARYASVLADDPGTAVLTLTSYGMVRRCRPHGHSATNVIALWKDAGRGTHEIPLEPGAHGVLLSTTAERARRRSADGRQPVENGSAVFNVGVFQVRAAGSGSGPAAASKRPSMAPALGLDELSIVTSWAEAAAETVAFDPERIPEIFADARSGAAWRGRLGLPEPTAELDDAFRSMARATDAAGAEAGGRSLDGLLRALDEVRPGESALDRQVRRALGAMLEERQTDLAMGQPVGDDARHELGGPMS
jgi:hypothetical protein